MADIELTVTNEQRQALVELLRNSTSGGGYENAFCAAIIRQAKWDEGELEQLLAMEERVAIKNLTAAEAPRDQSEVKARFNSVRAFRQEQSQWNAKTKKILLSKEAGSFLKPMLKKEMKGTIAEQLAELNDQLP